MKRNSNVDRDKKINFKGMIVGNPYVDPYTNAVTQFQTLYMHGIIPKYPSYQPWINHCSHDKQKYMKKGVS